MGLNSPDWSPAADPRPNPARRPDPLLRFTALVDTLSLAGFPSVHAARLRSAFVSELTRLLEQRFAADPSWVPRTDPIPTLRLQFPSAPSSATLGEQIARAVFEGLDSGKGPSRSAGKPSMSPDASSRRPGGLDSTPTSGQRDLP